MVFTFEREFPGWTVIASHCWDNGLPYGAAGGCVILSSPRLSQLATITKTTLFPGRCVAATYKLGDNTFNVVNGIMLP